MKILLAMSGGVDSSVCAKLLLEEGHDVVGVFMKHGIQPPNHSGAVVLPRRKHGCCSEEDAQDAARVAAQFGIPLHVVDFHDAFTELVTYFVEEYVRCRTPNPCVLCNAKLKFGRLFDMAETLGAECVATGHYARIVTGPDGQPWILRGRDDAKDQSYVLHRIPRERLARLRFPLGDFCKPEIRQLAIDAGLHVAEKRESQEICFVPEDDHAQFVREYLFRQTGEYPMTVGDFVTTRGENRGPH